MQTEREISVKISSERAAESTTGKIRALFWDEKARSKRAMKTGALCFVGSVAAIPLPIVHFILVPVLFLAAIAAPIYILRQSSVVLGGDGTCPTCKEPLTIVRSSYRFPLTDTCTACQSIVAIQPIEG